MMNLVLYIHGKGGSPHESRHYSSLFPGYDVMGLDYRTFTPWETGKEIYVSVKESKEKYEKIILIANSIGAFFSMHSGTDQMIEKAYFISPVVDMEKLICNMMLCEEITENELKDRRTIRTSSGEDLSWDYLCYVREHPVCWTAPTEILYGENDALTSYETISAFARKCNAGLTVMENGEHWFHTDEQMEYIDEWIRRSEK